MTLLNTRVNLEKHDDLYELIVDLNSGLTEAESRKANAKLVLLLANHIGDPDIFREAIACAKPRRTAKLQSTPDADPR